MNLRRSLYGCIILAILFSAAPAQAQGLGDSGLQAAVDAAIQQHRANAKAGFYYHVLTLAEHGRWGVAQAEMVRKDTGEVLPADFSIILAHQDAQSNWRVVLPDQAGAYLRQLDLIPESLLENESRAHIKDAYRQSATTLYSNHYLPWTRDSAAVVNQNYTAHGEGQLDFGFSGDIRTSKAGTLVFAYDAHTWSKCTGKSFTYCNTNYPNAWYYNNTVVIKHADGEYSAYLHLQTGSIPAAVINNCGGGAGGACTAVNIPVGTAIGTVGSIGYSTGPHLHFETGDFVYGRCDYPDVYDEDNDGNTTEKTICTGGINYNHYISTDFHEKPYSTPDCGTSAGQDPSLCMLFFPANTNLFSQNPSALLEDEFNTSSLDPRWHWVNEDPTHWSLTASPGNLRIVTQPGDLAGGSNNVPLLLQALPPFLGGDFDVQTRIVMTPGADRQQGGPVIYQDADNYVRLTYGYMSGLKFEFAREIGGDFQPVQAAAPPGIHDFYLRLAKAGPDYSAYYSTDGAAWISIGTHTDLSITPLEAGLLAFNGVGATADEIPADFDYFRMASAGPRTLSGDAGAAGVMLSYVDGTAKSVTSASDGTYSFTVPYGWSGSVTPSKPKYIFNPSSRSYTNLFSDQVSQNYRAITSMVAASNGALDGWVLESSESSGQGGALNAVGPALPVGDDALDRQYVSIVSFNTGALPDTAVITGVTLRLRGAGVVGTNPFSTHGSLMVDVRKGPFSSNAALQVQDFQAPASRNGVMILANNPVNGWYIKALASTNFVYINKTGVTQFRLRFSMGDNGDLSGDYLKFYSGNYLTTPSYRPVLAVKYYVP
ncbi:MAG: hypothetical protein ACM3QS_17675 [Bacteroidota bacterium]